MSFEEAVKKLKALSFTPGKPVTNDQRRLLVKIFDTINGNRWNVNSDRLREVTSELIEKSKESQEFKSLAAREGRLKDEMLHVRKGLALLGMTDTAGTPIGAGWGISDAAKKLGLSAKEVEKITKLVQKRNDAIEKVKEENKKEALLFKELQAKLVLAETVEDCKGIFEAILGVKL